jgi:hypothetical protein
MHPAIARSHPGFARVIDPATTGFHLATGAGELRLVEAEDAPGRRWREADGRFEVTRDIDCQPTGLARRARHWAAAFKAIRHLLVQDFHQLTPAPAKADDWDVMSFNAYDGREAVVFAFSGRPAGALCRSERSERGWRFSLLIPLAAAGIAADAAVFRFDFICNATSPIAGQNLIRLPKWGSIANHSNGNALARVTVIDSSGRGSQGWQ